MQNAGPPPSNSVPNTSRQRLDATVDKIDDLVVEFRQYKELTEMKLKLMLTKNRIQAETNTYLEARLNALENELGFVDEQPENPGQTCQPSNLASTGQSPLIIDVPEDSPASGTVLPVEEAATNRPNGGVDSKEASARVADSPVIKVRQFSIKRQNR